ncbi:MAG: peptidoglycan D,D-transpeptidase FtsI family protein [Opitutales bacterium]
MTKGIVSSFRLLLVGFLLLACFFALMGRLFQLHVIEQVRLSEWVQQSREKVDRVEAPRGQIRDRKGDLLATTRTVYTVGVDPHVYEAPEPEQLVLLARRLDVTPQVIAEAASKRFRAPQNAGEPPRPVRWVKLAERVEMDTYEAAMALKIPGVYGNREYIRHYPEGSLAAHVLGFVNKEGVAGGGVEAAMNFYLSGQDGWLESEHDGRRRELPQFRKRDVGARAGLDVELTIDGYVQHLAEKELERVAREYDPEGATIVVTEVETGAILALANYPAFDPNAFWDYEIETLGNRATQLVFEPGSTFKIVPAAAALNEGVASVRDVFDCSQSLARYGDRMIRLPADAHAMELLTLEEVVVKSSNRGAAQLGILLGEDRLFEYAQNFGFGERTGYPLGVETPGILHPPYRWDGLTISRLPMGHAVGASPLQIHYAMSVLANGGLLMEPLLVRRVSDAQGGTVAAFHPRVRRRVLEEATAREMSRILAQVTGPGGTARQAGLEEFAVAGKTGTSQKIINGQYSRTRHVASFTGFFPAEAPEVVVSVFVDEPKLAGVGYGGVVAAPAFKNLAGMLAQYLDIRPGLNREALMAWKGERAR